MKIIVKDYGPAHSLKIVREWTELNRENFAIKYNLKARTLKSYETGSRKIKFIDALNLIKNTGCILKIENKNINKSINANLCNEKEIIKLLRNWAGLTQKEFAEDIGLNESTICNYEMGVRRYTFETLMKICKKYGYVVTIEKK